MSSRFAHAALAQRGIHVCVQLYQPCALDERIETFVDPQGGPIIARWPGQWMNVVVDSREHLLALLAPGEGGVHQAIWSESAYLSVLHHCGVASGMVAAAVGTAITLPRFELLAAARAPLPGGRWRVTGRLRNAGTGRLTVAVAASAGRRFAAGGPPYREARAQVPLLPDVPADFIIETDFLPERVLVDPDVTILQIGRKGATRNL